MTITILLPLKSVLYLDPLSSGALRYASGRAKALIPVLIPICCMISCGLYDLSGLIYPVSRLHFAKGTMANKTTIIASLYRSHHQTIDEEVREDISGPLPPTRKLGCIYPLQEVRMDVLTETRGTTLPVSTKVTLLNCLDAVCSLHITTAP